MNVDYQVLTFKNQIKPKDIGGLGVELDQRKGSGNYSKDRTQFNIEYVGLDNHPTLSSKVYETIYTNNIHFNKGFPLKSLSRQGEESIYFYIYNLFDTCFCFII